MFKGSIVAIVTPFKRGKVDEEGFRRLIEFQIENGTSAIVPVGSTGESATLDMEEHKRTLEIAVEAARNRVPVIAGTGGNSTAEAIELTEHAKKIKADATLQVTPYYNKPTQEGMVQHFKAIANAVPLPQVLYNIPGRTGVNMLREEVERIASDLAEALDEYHRARRPSRESAAHRTRVELLRGVVRVMRQTIAPPDAGAD